jgi:2-aminoadipate transaminase
MSYKVDLSDIERGGETSLTQQLVDRFGDAIESGVLEPGEKLPPTRQLAEEVGVNHLTAARVYRRLAELGYVTASVGRGTFVRTLSPAVAADQGDDWQLYALPQREPSYSEQVMADAFNLPLEEGMISLSTGFPSPEHYPVADLARISAEVFEEEGGNAISYLTAEGLFDLREQLALRGERFGFASGPEEIIVTSGAKQAINLAAQAILEPGDVAVVESPSFVGVLESIRAAGARVLGVPVDQDGFDVESLERLLTKHEVKLVALQTACQNPTGRDTSDERRERLAELARERSFFVLEDRVYADLRFDGTRPRPLRELAPAHVVYVNSLSKSRRADPSSTGSRCSSSRTTSTPRRSSSTSPRAIWPRGRTTATSSPPSRSTASAATPCWRRSTGTSPASTGRTPRWAAITSGSRSTGPSTSAPSTRRRSGTEWPSRPATP